MFGDITSEMMSVVVLLCFLLKGVMTDDPACDNMRCTELIHELNRFDSQDVCRKLGDSINCVSDFLNNCQELTEEMKESVRNDVVQMRQDHSDTCLVTAEGGGTDVITDRSEICDNTRCAEFMYGMNWFDQQQMCGKFRDSIDCVSNFAENCPTLTEDIRTTIREDTLQMIEQFDRMCPGMAVALKPQRSVLITLTFLQIIFFKMY